MVDGVARVDYDKCKGCGMCAQKCPKKIILFPLKDNPYPPVSYTHLDVYKRQHLRRGENGTNY